MLLLLRPTRICPTRIYLWPSNARIHKHAHVCTHSLRLFYFSLWLLFNSSVKKKGHPHLPAVNFRRARQKDLYPVSSFSCFIISFPASTHWLSWNRRLPLHRPHITVSVSLAPLPSASLSSKMSPNTPVVRELSQNHRYSP